MKRVSEDLTTLLSLSHTPIAVSFCDQAPTRVNRIEEPALSGCSYWRLVQDRGPFYTTAEDHYGCPIGAHTHGVTLPEGVAQELSGLVGQMLDLESVAE